ncbi:hypothetical protein [Morganella psychrotolerans]|uniref:hypothetical protein n=1 Tax=Morganella psychrotolerans TaxID=368603 RepID=UPI0039B05440
MKKLFISITVFLILTSNAFAMFPNGIDKATDLQGDDFWGCDNYASGESQCYIRGMVNNYYLINNWNAGTACPDGAVYIYNEDTSRYTTLNKLIACEANDFDYTLTRDKAGNVIASKWLKGKVIATEKIAI